MRFQHPVTAARWKDTTSRWQVTTTDGQEFRAPIVVSGSAASAVQFVPEIAHNTSALHLFQRTANWFAPKEDTPYTAEQLAHFTRDANAIHQSRAQIYKELNEFILFNDPEKQREHTTRIGNTTALFGAIEHRRG
ncbi:MAG: hypothetical protein EXR86_02410 [Gammaproteobacteria bacterium]|nr:hypothetical protein [Gammaproteobacteria bacterium]